MITYQNGITKKSLSFVFDNLHRLGEINSIAHKRNKSQIFYETTINGTDDIMIIKGGLGSGYGGEGPNGLHKLLVELGLSEELANEYVYENTDTEYSFEVEF
ncbi:hypothetical protein [Bacillus sp. MMSF_3328]|uniref:hypothetical protein n=1 Tax=Bacillus sp. MMSF_3328 TaxID=3047080 RepID=UPI00273D8D9F|nr:hypothetical protein [Bacillus sp. MMSF_3328]